MKTNTIIASAIGSLLTMAVTVGTAQAAAEKMEKCYGVVKAGKNDCQTSVSACAGSATKDGQKDAWLYLPKGTCEKLVGSALSAAVDGKKK